MFHWYGFMVGVGVVVALVITERLLKRRGVPEAEVGLAGWWVIGGGIVGARLYHVISGWSYYHDRLMTIIFLWEGGLGIIGGILGGVVGLLIHSFRRMGWGRSVAERYFQVSDAAVVGVAAGQAIGRVGNYINRELYGGLTDLPWGLQVPGMEGRYHPLFLYESLLLLILVFFLYRGYSQLEIVRGRVTGLYLVGYGLIRFFLEGMRIESWMVLGVRVAQGLTLLMIVVGAALLWWGRRQVKRCN